MQDEIVVHGAELMLYGMGTVVVFLGLLVLTTSAMSRLLARYFPEPEPVPVAPPLPTAGRGGGQDAQVVAAITAAIRQHRAQRK